MSAGADKNDLASEAMPLWRSEWGELHLGEQEPTSHGRQLDRHQIASRAVKAYQAGDPLRRIAADAGMRTYDMLRLLSTRSESLRRRCSATAEVLRTCKVRIDQLLSAGIESHDIPKVLVALGAAMDVDIASELLKSPHLLKDADSAPPRVYQTDKMGLLYVTGYHRRLEPDFEFALGKMPLPGLQEYRMILSHQLSSRQMGQVIALIETTAERISSGEDTGISYSEYKIAREAIILELGADADSNFPPSAERIRDRTEGSWHAALTSVGMTLPHVRGEFSPHDYEDASQAYRATRFLFGSPKDVASYDSWMIAETAMGRERPSVVAIGRHFGAWESVIGAYVPLEEDELRGIVSQLRTEAAADHAWARAGELVSEVLRTMPWNSFLSIQYGDGADGGPQPYAQVTPGPDGAWCEIVSEEFLQPDDWPIYPVHLLEHGWSKPDVEVPNWYKEAVPLEDAGHVTLEGLRNGRSCYDADELRWHTGSFPSGTNPDGDVTVADVLKGSVQTLRNAS
jgi:hypothetical protein